MRLQLATWQEVEDYLKQSKGIIIPIGSTEQHGPMGLIGTDALCPEVIAHRVGEAAGILIGPTISIGMAQHHLGFSGSVTLRPTTLISMIRDYVQSLAKQGFERFYFLNGHGGNIATLNAAFDEIYAERSMAHTNYLGPQNSASLRCRHQDWFTLPTARKISEREYGDKEGMHATPSEISITQFAFPEAIKTMPHESAAPVERAFADAEDYRALYPDGRMAAESYLATPEIGAELVAGCVDDVIADYTQFLSQD